MMYLQKNEGPDVPGESNIDCAQDACLLADDAADGDDAAADGDDDDDDDPHHL